MILYKTDYYLYTVLAVKSPSFLEEKFFTRCKLQGTSCKFLEKRRKDEIAALSSKVHKDRQCITLTLTLSPQGRGNIGRISHSREREYRKNIPLKEEEVFVEMKDVYHSIHKDMVEEQVKSQKNFKYQNSFPLSFSMHDLRND